MRLVYDYIETEIGKIYVVMNEVGLVKVEVIEDRWSDFKKSNPTIDLDKKSL